MAAEQVCEYATNQPRIGSMEEILRTEAADTVATDPIDAEVYAMLMAVVRSLVDRADEVVVVPLADASGISFQVHSAAEDVGKLIGKGGRTARAIRTILSGNSAKYKRRYSVDFAKRPE